MSFYPLWFGRRSRRDGFLLGRSGLQAGVGPGSGFDGASCVGGGQGLGAEFVALSAGSGDRLVDGGGLVVVVGLAVLGRGNLLRLGRSVNVALLRFAVDEVFLLLLAVVSVVVLDEGAVRGRRRVVIVLLLLRLRSVAFVFSSSPLVSTCSGAFAIERELERTL